MQFRNFLGIIKESHNVISVRISIQPAEIHSRHFPNIYSYGEIKTFQFSFRTYKKGFFFVVGGRALYERMICCLRSVAGSLHCFVAALK